MTTATAFSLLVLAVAWILYAFAGRGSTTKVLERVIIFGIFVTPFIPIIVTPSLFFPFITGKNFLFRVVVEIITAAWLILAIHSPEYRPKKSAVFWAFLALAATMLVSTFIGADPFRSFWSNFERMEGYITLIHLFAFFLVAASVLFRRNVWNLLLKTTLGVSVYISLYGVLQLLGFLTINQSGVRLDGTLGNAAYLAIYCVFAIFFAGILATREKGVRISKEAMWWSVGVLGFALLLFLLSLTQTTISSPVLAALVGSFIAVLGVAAVVLAKKYSVSFIYAAIAILNFVVLYYTATRGALLGFAAGIILMAIVVLIGRKGSKVIQRSALWLIIIVAIGAGGFFALKNTSFVQKSPVLSRFASINLSDSETTARFYIWNMAWQGFLEKPVFGWGQENFNLVFNKFYAPQIYSQEQWFDRTHDIFFDWLVTGGIVGFTAYFFLFGATLWLIWKNAEISFTEKTLFTGLFAAYLVNNIFVFDNITSLVVYVMILAYVSGISGKPFRKMGSAESAVSEKSTMRVVMPIVIIVFAGVVYFVNWPGYATSRAIIGALTAVSENSASSSVPYFEKAASYDALGREEVTEQIVENAPSIVNSSADLPSKQAFATFAQGIVARQLSQTPSDAREWLFAGNFYATLGESNLAEAAYQKSVTLSPNKQTILFSLGSQYIQEKKYDQAFAVFKQAYVLDQSDMEAFEWYVAAAVYDNQTALVPSLLASTTPDIALSDTIASAYLNTSNWPAIIKIFQDRIAYLPDNVQNHLSLVAAYMKLNETAQAITEIQNVIKLYPSYASVGEQAIQDIKSGKPLP